MNLNMLILQGTIRGSRGKRSRENQQQNHKINAKLPRLNEFYPIQEKKPEEDYQGMLRMAFLNCNGINEETSNDTLSLAYTHTPDIIGLLETKLREEDGVGVEDLPGYETLEVRRSDLAEDKQGGGIVVYMKNSNGLRFRQKKFKIQDKLYEYVNKERVWITVETEGYKTAFCFVYMGFQCGEDRHGNWNDGIYLVLEEETRSLWRSGHRVIISGDMNGWIGNEIQGNDPRVNNNGERFLNFIDRNEMFHLNGSKKTSGVFTRHASESSTAIDYVSMSKEHSGTFRKMVIDEKGDLGGDSDHVWSIVDVDDKFRKKKKCAKPSRKESWDIDSSTNWSFYKTKLDEYLQKSDGDDPVVYGNKLQEILKRSISEGISVKKVKEKAAKKYPKSVLEEMKVKQRLQAEWRTLRCEVTRNPDNIELRVKMMRAKVEASKQEEKLSEEMRRFWVKSRKKEIEKLEEKSTEAIKLFWSYVKQNGKKATNIQAVVDPLTGEVKEGKDMKRVVEEFLENLFKGNYDKDDKMRNLTIEDIQEDEEVDVDEATEKNRKVIKDLEKEISEDEVLDMINRLDNGKAEGIDHIPAEALKNGTLLLVKKLTKLFNMVKTTGRAPVEWKIGRVVNVFKAGDKEDLANYRPLTVAAAVCGLYSKIMNSRLTSAVEELELLGEMQQGFRKGRCGSDNSFVLNTILMKAGAQSRKVHLAYLDLKKAYDTVNREELWKRMRKMGFGGSFLSGIQALYVDDSIVTEVNGERTQPLYLGRGLRQGCSLSPCLFALYMVDWGKELEEAEVGFKLGRIVVSALFFADDVVLISRTGDGLKKLLSISSEHCRRMKMEISTKKSQVVSPIKDTWDLYGEDGGVYTLLDKVLSYKYLGIETFNTMMRTSISNRRSVLVQPGDTELQPDITPDKVLT